MPAVLAHYGLVSVACCCDPTFIAYPHGLHIVRYLDWFFRLVWYLVLCFSRSLCVNSADGSSAGSCRCLAQCCRGSGFFPKYAVFIASLRDFCYCLRNFRACDYIPWLCLWGGLLAPYAYPALRPMPAVAGLVGFSLRTSSLVVPACVCRSFLGWQSCVFSLSSCSAWGRLLLSLFLVLLL